MSHLCIVVRYENAEITHRTRIYCTRVHYTHKNSRIHCTLYIVLRVSYLSPCTGHRTSIFSAIKGREETYLNPKFPASGADPLFVAPPEMCQFYGAAGGRRRSLRDDKNNYIGYVAAGGDGAARRYEFIKHFYVFCKVYCGS